MALSTQQRLAMENAEYQVRTRIRNELERRVRGSWLALGRLGAGQFERWLNQAVVLVQQGKRSVAQMVAVRIALDMEHTPRPVTPSALNPRGVPEREVYTRPKNVLYSELDKGKGLQVALGSSAAALSTLLKTDLQLSYTHQAQDALINEAKYGEFSSYKRVLRGSENCAVCVIAATQVYHTDELMPIHNNCDCGITEIIGPDDEPPALDDNLRRDVRAKAKERGVNLGDLDNLSDEVVTRQHEEIGPVIVWRKHNFSGGT